MMNLPPFDPSQGEPIDSELAQRAFADAAELIRQFEVKRGSCEQYLVIRIPSTDLFLLYGFQRGNREIAIVRAKTVPDEEVA